MPKRSQGQKRPADVNARAVMIAKIATGEIEDVTTDEGKNAAAVALGGVGGKARARLACRLKRAILYLVNPTLGIDDSPRHSQVSACRMGIAPPSQGKEALYDREIPASAANWP